jgi:hypothetical protein
MIGDHQNPHLREADRRRDGSVVADAALLIVAFMTSAGLVVALVLTLVVWVT